MSSPWTDDRNWTDGDGVEAPRGADRPMVGRPQGAPLSSGSKEAVGGGAPDDGGLVPRSRDQEAHALTGGGGAPSHEVARRPDRDQLPCDCPGEDALDDASLDEDGSEVADELADDDGAGPFRAHARIMGGGLGRRRTKRRRRVPGEEAGTGRIRVDFRQRMLILDCWVRSKLCAEDFASMVGVSPHTLYAWKKRFEDEGPAGLEDKQRGRGRGSRLPETTKRAILLMKRQHPDWGQDRIHDMLLRTTGFVASPGAIGRVLGEEGYVVLEVPTRPHEPPVQRFERSRPNQRWQTDLFTFVLKRQGRRVYMVVFMDDYSRFIVGFGIHASASGALVREVFEAAITNFGAPEEVLTDNGTQYHTWRGESAFTKLCARRGIKQIVASPRRPQTLGKAERFWGTLWRECVERAIFRDLGDARIRIGHFIDYYNFQRTHTGIGGLVPADRFFEAAPAVKETLKQRIAKDAKELGQHGVPRKPFYLTGQVGGRSISLHAEGERVVYTEGELLREEVDLSAPGRRAKEADDVDPMPEPLSVHGAPRDLDDDDDPSPPPGTSVLDEVTGDLESFEPGSRARGDGLEGDGAQDLASPDSETVA